MWLDREFHTGKYPDWYELGTGYMEWAEDIPWDMPRKEVDRLFAKFDAQVRADPNHYSNQRLKEILEDIKNTEASEFIDDVLEGPMTKAEKRLYDAEMAKKK